MEDNTIGSLILWVILIGVFIAIPIWITNEQGKSKRRHNFWLWGLCFGWLGVLIGLTIPKKEIDETADRSVNN